MVLRNWQVFLLICLFLIVKHGHVYCFQKLKQTRYSKNEVMLNSLVYCWYPLRLFWFNGQKHGYLVQIPKLRTGSSQIMVCFPFIEGKLATSSNQFDRYIISGKWNECWVPLKGTAKWCKQVCKQLTFPLPPRFAIPPFFFGPHLSFFFAMAPSSSRSMMTKNPSTAIINKDNFMFEKLNVVQALQPVFATRVHDAAKGQTVNGRFRGIKWRYISLVTFLLSRTVGN